jgi:hypothetical protein
MTKLSQAISPEEIERRRALSRARNIRYLAKNDEAVKARRKAAGKAYLERLKSDPAYADKLAERKRKAVERAAAWKKANPEKAKVNARATRQRNPEREAAKVQRRNAVKIMAMPAWADKKAIDRHYANARYLTEISGHAHHVDHIIPLRGANVCGLHVENNLRAIPHFLNTRKSNKLEI